MGRTLLFCLLVGALLAGAKLAAADLIYSSSPSVTPLLLGLILLGVGILASLGYACSRLASLVRLRSAARDHRTSGKPKSSVTNPVGLTT